MMCPSHYMHSTHIVGVLPWNPPFNSSGDELTSTFCPFSRNHFFVVGTTAYSLTHQKIEQVTEGETGCRFDGFNKCETNTEPMLKLSLKLAVYSPCRIHRFIDMQVYAQV